jgi:hypothetical protein
MSIKDFKFSEEFIHELLLDLSEVDLSCRSHLSGDNILFADVKDPLQMSAPINLFTLSALEKIKKVFLSFEFWKEYDTKRILQVNNLDCSEHFINNKVLNKFFADSRYYYFYEKSRRSVDHDVIKNFMLDFLNDLEQKLSYASYLDSTNYLCYSIGSYKKLTHGDEYLNYLRSSESLGTQFLNTSIIDILNYRSAQAHMPFDFFFSYSCGYHNEYISDTVYDPKCTSCFNPRNYLELRFIKYLFEIKKDIPSVFNFKNVLEYKIHDNMYYSVYYDNCECVYNSKEIFDYIKYSYHITEDMKKKDPKYAEYIECTECIRYANCNKCLEYMTNSVSNKQNEPVVRELSNDKQDNPIDNKLSNDKQNEPVIHELSNDKQDKPIDNELPNDKQDKPVSNKKSVNTRKSVKEIKSTPVDVSFVKTYDFEGELRFNNNHYNSLSEYNRNLDDLDHEGIKTFIEDAVNAGFLGFKINGGILQKGPASPEITSLKEGKGICLISPFMYKVLEVPKLISIYYTENTECGSGKICTTNGCRKLHLFSNNEINAIKLKSEYKITNNKHSIGVCMEHLGKGCVKGIDCNKRHIYCE